MKGRLSASAALCAALVLGCAPEKPCPFEQRNLGIRAIFPGQPIQATYPEDTPFGPMQWTNFSYSPGGRMDLNFHIDVGNLPPGDKGGATVPAALATYRKFLDARYGGIQATDLPEGRGPGFRYKAPGVKNLTVEGVVVLKRGRLHHAQATVARADDPRLRSFLDSFQVD